MGKYNFFQGGPAATDLTGLFAQLNTGAVGKSLARAGETVGKAITARYVQTKKEKEGAALADQYINSDMGDEILKWNNVPRDEYKGLTDSAKSRLLPAFKTGLTIDKFISDRKLVDQEKWSGEHFNDSMANLTRPLISDDPEVNKKEILERFSRDSLRTMTPEHRKQFGDTKDKMLDRVEKGMPIEYGDTKLAPKGMIPWRAGGGAWTLSNLPADKVPTTTNLGKLVSEHKVARDAVIAAKKAGAGEDKIKELTMTADLYTKAMEKEVSKSGMSLRFGEDGQLLSFSTGGDENLTVGTKGKHQYALTKFKSSISGLEDVTSLFKDEYVGVKGYLGEHIFDKGVGSLPFEWAKDMVNEDRIKFRNKVTQFNATIMRIVGDENRFSDQDRQAILKGIVNLEATNSPATAIIAMENLRESLIGRALFHAKELTQKGEEVDMTWLPTTAVIREYRNKNLLESGARDILDSQFDKGGELLDMRTPEEVADKLRGKVPVGKLAKILKALFPND